MGYDHSLYYPRSSKLFWSNSNNQYPKNIWADKPEELLALPIISQQQCIVLTQRCLLHCNRNSQWLKLPGIHIDIRQKPNFFLIPLICWYEPSTLCLCNPIKAEALFLVLFKSLSSGRPPHQVDCLTP